MSATQQRTVAILAPLFLFDLTLLMARIVTRFNVIIARPSEMDSLDWLSVMASSLFFHFGLLIFLGGVLQLSRRRALVVAVQATAMLVMLVELVAHIYFLHTGTALDFPQLAFTLGRPSDLALVMAVVTPGSWVVLNLFLLTYLAAPWLLPRVLHPGPEPEPQPAHLRRAVLACVFGLPLLCVGLLPLSNDATDLSVVRDPVLHLFATLKNQGPVAEKPPPLAAQFDLQISRFKDVPERNIVIVILESTRAKSVAPYVDLPTTPFFAELAKTSLLAQRAYTVIPHTSKALIATLCGIDPSHTVANLALKLGLLQRCLPALLVEKGYQTVFIQSAASQFEARIPTTTGMGFQEFVGTGSFSTEGFQKANFLGYEDEVMLAPSEKWLRAHGNKPFLATYMTVSAHHDCEKLTRHGFLQIDGDPGVNRYQNAIRSVDFFLRALFDQYKALGLYENTIFVVLGDHGEAFGEHGRFTHDEVPWEEGMRIPMLFHDPRGQIFKPAIVANLVNQLDVVPTLLDGLGWRLTRGNLPGLPVSRVPPGRPLMMSCLNDNTCFVHLLGNEKFIHHFGRMPDEYFDLAADPKELVNLAPRRPGSIKKKLDELQEWDRHVRARYWGEGMLAEKRQ